jgi:hypothetical protein
MIAMAVRQGPVVHAVLLLLLPVHLLPKAPSSVTVQGVTCQNAAYAYAGCCY